MGHRSLNKKSVPKEGGFFLPIRKQQRARISSAAVMKLENLLQRVGDRTEKNRKIGLCIHNCTDKRTIKNNFLEILRSRG